MKFSVIIPTFNRRHLIGQAIESVLDQQEVEIEAIVVDDGSTDGTVDWLANRYADQPVRVIPNIRTKGPAGARNTGILAANGNFIALLDSDDYFLPHHLSDCQRVLQDFSDVDVIVGQAQYERNGKPISCGDPHLDWKRGLAPISQATEEVTVFSDNFFSHLLEYGSCFVLSTVVLRVNVAKELMNETLIIAEDYEYWVRLSRNYRFACLNYPQACYVLHGSNISSEETGSAEGNAPGLLAAYKIMLAYPALERKQIRLIEEKMAAALFSWAYRCRKHRQLREATRLHLRSFRLGKRMENTAALLKVVLVSLFPGLEAQRR